MVEERYTIKLDNVSVDVEIKVVNKEVRYFLIMPVFEEPTRALMEKIRERIAFEIGMNRDKTLTHNKLKDLRNRLSERIERWIDNEIPGIDSDTKNNMLVSILNRSFGIGDMEFLLKDYQLEEIVVNSANEPVRVYHKKYGWLTTNIRINSEEEIQNYAKSIARQIGKEITLSSPLLDAHLPNGDRINAIIYPISDKGSSITIRMFAREPWTFTDFVMNKTVTSEILALLWTLIQYEMNILISGGTGAGKTSFLNILMPFIQPSHRIVSIEDTRELQLPQFLYWCPLKVKGTNIEGKSEITMSDLLVNSLRMRPDRIILGEIRKGRDAEILFEAMHTGHSVYATLHADTSHQTIRRLVNPPLSVPPIMVEAINLNVVMYRDRSRNIRRVLQIAEVIPEESIGDNVSLKANILYRWKPRTDEIIKSSEDIRLFQDISLHTGFSKQEIMEDINRKKMIIEWLFDNNIRELNDIGTIMRSYYLDPDDVYNIVENNQKPDTILKQND